MAEFSIFDGNGNRLFLTAEERQAFLKATELEARELRAFCQVLYYTGCRISEALELCPIRVNYLEQTLRFRSLKKRDKLVYRDVPIPTQLMVTLDELFGVRDILMRKRFYKKNQPLWSWSRRHAWFLVKGVMSKAQIPDGAHKNPMGLRHGYGVAAIRAQIPLNMIQKWMGHADITTTAVYAKVLEESELAIAARMWS